MTGQTMREHHHDTMPEAAFQKRITDLCDLYRLKWHHETDSRKSKSGFPDLVIVGNEIIFAELKREKGRVSAAQADWQIALDTAQVRTYVWRPSDWPTIQRVLAHLAGRTH